MTFDHKTNLPSLPPSLPPSLTFAEGMMAYELRIRSGYSSLILASKSVPMPEPVPPPNECVIWKLCRGVGEREGGREEGREGGREGGEVEGSVKGSGTRLAGVSL